MAVAERAPEQARGIETKLMPTTFLVAGNRGFCEGVRYATSILWTVHQDNSAKDPDAITYCIHPIVHNEVVIEAFEKVGIRFVQGTKNVPRGATAVFSAHGHPPKEYEIAQQRDLVYYDGTCPFVIKVHKEAIFYTRRGYTVIYIGQQGHQEAIGVTREIPDQHVLISTPAEAEELTLNPGRKYAVLSQTTMDYQKVRRMQDVLRGKAQGTQVKLVIPNDICAATRNRQDAVWDLISQGATLIFSIGSSASSNTKKLVEVAEKAGVRGFLIESPDQLTTSLLRGHQVVGFTSGASAPETQLWSIVERAQAICDSPNLVTVDPVVDESDINFRLPEELQSLYDRYTEERPNWETELYQDVKITHK